jgi:DNA replication protein DnaC
LFGERHVIKRLPEQVLPDFAVLHAQLQQHPHLTLQLAWEEYRQIHPEGYGYSRWNWRQNQALTRRVLAARLRGTACVENIDYRAERGLNRSVIRALAQESAWVANHEHIFVLGPTGVGKSYVASALAQKLAGTAIGSTTRGPRRCSVI